MEDNISIDYEIGDSADVSVITRLNSEVSVNNFMLERTFQACRILRREILPVDYRNDIVNKKGSLHLSFSESGFMYECAQSYSLT